ncbi:M20 aminoacylase family protein [Dickeya zeae]|uniref:M20 aminoacylase family protein n=1 Tax=Dickeya zeae TaxID=204042 RepID=UPI001CF394C2|nr:M20 aminoacylase family protein [Dickeya zeae]MCA6988269.1 M20 family metallopeptidase [Dickeya zeae]
MRAIPEDIIQQAIIWRREIHAHPEIGLQEFNTSAKISSLLREYDLEVHTGIAGTGVVGVLRHGEGPAIALRADIDALPIQENNAVAWCSTSAGTMHACGHDGHTAILLGAARYLSQTRAFNGTVYFIFQPAEENAGGGRLMVEEGIFTRFPVSAVYALHNWPGLPVGEVAVSAGPMMASQDNFFITLTGVGCHAAMPEKGADPVLAGAHLITALQTITTRRLSPLDSAVISVTQLQAGEAINVVPQTMHVSGTLRCLSQAARKRCQTLMAEYVEQLTQPFGVTGSIRWEYGYPVTVNHTQQAKMLADAARHVPGITQVHTQLSPSMAAEDFAYFLEACPGAYLWLGADGPTPGATLHNPHYDFNDQLIAPGIGLWVSLVERSLGPVSVTSEDSL